MITKLRAKNFKSWEDTGDLTFAPLTGLFGSNSSGKTSILQMLLVLKQTAESTDPRRVLHTGDDRSLVDLGTFSDLIHSHAAGTALQLWLSWNLNEPLQIRDPESEDNVLFETRELSFDTTICEVEGRPAVESFAYRFDNKSFGMVRRPASNAKDKDRYDLVTQEYTPKRPVGRPWPLPNPIKCYGFPDEAIGYFQNTGFLPLLTLAFENAFSQVAYLGPLREHLKRTYIWAGDRPRDVGVRGDHAIPALLAARAAKLRTPKSTSLHSKSQPIEERILQWLREMKAADSFSLKPIREDRKDYEFRVKTTGASPEVLITDVGFGVSQLLPVLVLCYYVPRGSTVILEQPEIHLHPSIQATLADVLIDVVKTRDVQVVVESHSEHLLRRLQRRIAEEAISPQDTALYFCKMGQAASRIERLEVDMFGRISNWPPDFFGDELEDLAAQTEAAARRS